MLLFTGMLIAQPNCQYGKANITVTSGNITQHLSTSGAILTDGSGNAAYQIKVNDQLVPIIYEGGIWLGGITRANDVKFTGATYVVAGQDYTDWYPGVLDSAYNLNHPCINWDRFFVLTYGDIQTAINLLYNGNGTINTIECNLLPPHVLAWPGKGNPYFKNINGFDLPDMYAVPFYDYNTDGMYDPCAGDLPMFQAKEVVVNNHLDVLNSFPDYLSLSIINDALGPHNLSGGEPNQVEVHQYAFDYHTQDSLEQTTFYLYRLINKSESALDKSYFGLWFDPDLGCYLDDFGGCSSENNLIYFYNTDAVDGSPGSSCPGSNSFGSEIPISAISLLDGLDELSEISDPPGWLRKGMTSAVYFNNCSAGLVDPSTCDPDGPDLDFYNPLRGKWHTGEPITYGGNGFNPESTDTTLYVFDGNPSDFNSWTMCSSGVSQSDIRMLMSTGGGTMEPGFIYDVVAAIHTVSNVPYPCPDIQPLMDVKKAADNFKNHGWRRKSTTSQTTQILDSHLPWDFQQVDNGFNLVSAESALAITLTDITGKQISKIFLLPNENLTWRNDQMTSQIITIQVSSSNYIHNYKLWVH